MNLFNFQLGFERKDPNFLFPFSETGSLMFYETIQTAISNFRARQRSLGFCALQCSRGLESSFNTIEERSGSGWIGAQAS